MAFVAIAIPGSFGGALPVRLRKDGSNGLTKIDPSVLCAKVPLVPMAGNRAKASALGRRGPGVVWNDQLRFSLAGLPEAGGRGGGARVIGVLPAVT